MSDDAGPLHDLVAARVAALLIGPNGRRRARPVPVDVAMRLLGRVAAGAACAWDDGGRVAGTYAHTVQATLVLVARVDGLVGMAATRVASGSCVPGRGWSCLRLAPDPASGWAIWIADARVIRFSGPELDAVQEYLQGRYLD